jgi:hypothetical protein
MLAELGMTAGAGLLQALTAGDSMSPEQREIMRILKGKLGVAQNVQGQIDATTQRFKTEANQTNAATDASMARRRMPLSPGQTSLAHADTTATYGNALSQAIPQIQHNAADEQMGILSQMAGLAPQPQQGGVQGLGGLLYNLMMLKKKKEAGLGGPLGDYNQSEVVYA